MDSSVRNLGWRGRWIGWRNRVLGSTAFQHWTARCPLMRPIARRRARAIFDLVAGFTYSQILAACIDLGLFDMLAERPYKASDVASRTCLPVASAERLLHAAAALGLVERLGDFWVLGSDGAALRGNPGIAEMVAHHRLFYADLADPVALLRRGGGGGKLAELWAYAESPGKGDAGAVADYSALMAASQPLVAAQALDAYPFGRHRRLLDLGGGEGAFLAAVAARHPHLELTLFDLPAVGDRARARLGDRAQTVGGDFLRDPLPLGHDAISLVRILHDHDDAPALRLLRNIRAALAPGGTLIIVEPLAGAPGARRMGDAYFGFYLLAMGSGKPRSAVEIDALLRNAGFTTVRQHRTALPLTTGVITAR